MQRELPLKNNSATNLSGKSVIIFIFFSKELTSHPLYQVIIESACLQVGVGPSQVEWWPLNMCQYWTEVMGFDLYTQWTRRSRKGRFSHQMLCIISVSPQHISSDLTMQNSQHNAKVKNTSQTAFLTLWVLVTSQLLASYRISGIFLAWLSPLIQQSCKERLSPFYEWGTEVQKVYVLRRAWSPRAHKSCRNLDPGLPGTNAKHSWNFL